jgi:RNase P protein component
VSSPSFTLVWGPSHEGGIAAVVGKGVARRSVDRHLLKRRMITLMAPKADHTRFLIAYARGNAATLPQKAFIAEFSSLLGRLPR